jgi:predicted transcriptional regulator
MDSAPAPASSTDASRPETDAERQARIAWEAEGIAKARASVAAGYYATSAEVKAWIDSLGTERPLPVPYPRQPRPR